MTPVSPADTISFERARPRLVSVARRVLGNPADADDVVQDAWMRWLHTDRSAVRDPAAFLVTTTTRLALNHGQSARVRREMTVAPSLVDAVDADADPAAGTEQRDAVELALRTVLESLSTERARRVRPARGLRLSAPEDRECAAASPSERATARRARPPPRLRRTPLDVNAHELRRLVEFFLAAAQTGDLARARTVPRRRRFGCPHRCVAAAGGLLTQPLPGLSAVPRS